MRYDGILDHDDVPSSDEPETLDVRDLPPPKPLKRTLEELQSLPDGGVLVQINDRLPQHLFARLDDRGFAYRSTDGEPVYTAIWESES
ncbi:MAG: DUF2249 domain-containing protein [Halanaeroarchaeum sp.]